MKTPRFLLILLAAVLLYACALTPSPNPSPTAEAGNNIFATEREGAALLPTPTTFAWPSASPGPTATEEGVISVGDEKVAAEDQPIEQVEEETGLSIEVTDESGIKHNLAVESGQAGGIPEGVESKPAYQTAVDRLMKLIAQVTKSVNGKGPVASLTDLGVVFSDGYVNGQYVVNLDLTVKSIGSRHPGQSYPVGTGFCLPIVNGRATQYEPQRGTRGHYFQRDIEGQQIIEFNRDGKLVRKISPVVLDENGDVVQFETWVKASLSTEEQQFSDLDGIEFDGAFWEINGELDENARMEMTDFGAVLLNPDTNYIYAVIINGEAHKADFDLMAGQELAEISIFKGKTISEQMILLHKLIDLIPLPEEAITRNDSEKYSLYFPEYSCIILDANHVDFERRAELAGNGKVIEVIDFGYMGKTIRLNIQLTADELTTISEQRKGLADMNTKLFEFYIFFGENDDGSTHELKELMHKQNINLLDLEFKLFNLTFYEFDSEYFKDKVLLSIIVFNR